jgi:hypothetical protein
VRLSPKTCRVKPLRIKNAIVQSCWTYFTKVTVTKLLTFTSHSKTIQKVVLPTRSPRQQWPPCRTKNDDLSIVFSVGSGSGLISTPVVTTTWNVRHHWKSCSCGFSFVFEGFKLKSETEIIFSSFFSLHPRIHGKLRHNHAPSHYFQFIIHQCCYRKMLHNYKCWEGRLICSCERHCMLNARQICVLKFCTFYNNQEMKSCSNCRIQQATTVHRGLKIHELVLYDVQVKPPVKYALSNRFASI